METNLKEYLNKIEHLDYSSRLPTHASLFQNKAILSKIMWDIHSYNAKKFYKSNNKNYESSLEKYGYLTGKFDVKKTKLLKDIFNKCKKIELDPFDFHSDYVYEPRKNLHDDMKRINEYFEPNDFFFKNIPLILDPMKDLIEKENQFYWKVASCRIFKVKPNNKTQGYHKDDQALAIKKLFFYPDGANKEIGSTILKDKFNNEVIIDLEPGSWLIFENSLCEHQAYSSDNCLGRPTIEIDIMPDFHTDTSLSYTGINSWYPWFPISDTEFDIKGLLNFNDVENRNLKRLAGLCNINKCDSYKFPCEFSDYYDEGSSIFSNNDNNESKNENKIESHIKEDINDIIDKKGLVIFMFTFLKIIPLVFVKKLINRFK
tara:strand:- start:514 stop:1632 length:1119 start_codon:yes stop_codon:yes gene_type:complete